jgi:hypothetical protein
MTTLGNFVRLKAKVGNPRGYVGGSMRIKATNQHSLGTSHHRMFPLTILTLLAVAFGFNPAVRA